MFCFHYATLGRNKKRRRCRRSNNIQRKIGEETILGELEKTRSAVRTSGPAAGPPHAFAHFVEPCGYAAASRFIFLAGGNPADPLVARTRRNVLPYAPDDGIGLNCFPKVRRQLVCRSVRNSFYFHVFRFSQYSKVGDFCSPGGALLARVRSLEKNTRFACVFLLVRSPGRKSNRLGNPWFSYSFLHGGNPVAFPPTHPSFESYPSRS